MTEIAILAERLSYSYGTRQALKGLDFQIPAGSLFGLLGPNGSGKTTLFRLLCTLLPVQEGVLEVCGLNVARCQAAVRRSLGVTFQSPAVDVRLTVAENLKCHGSLYGLSGSGLKSRVVEMLNRFQLEDRAATLVGQLSGGLKRRVELAKGLMHSPRVLLLDEPTTGLDPRARQEFWELLVTQMKSQGTTVVAATHLMTEAELCDQLLLLDEGRIVACGSPHELQGRLSGERLTLKLRNAAAVQKSIEDVLHTSVKISGNQMSLRVQNSAEQISLLLAGFREEILGLELTRPSLEDVFLELTGRSLIAPGAGHE